MTCGDIAWWRAPDIQGLLQRHGQAEHLVVQFDLLGQPARNARAEYAIPGASKTQNGKTGYADVVSIATGEIWEIKPDKPASESAAVREANWYVTNATAQCGPQWKLGTSFTTQNRYGVPEVVYRIEGNGVRAELLARQGAPGAVLYRWQINGKEQASLAAYYGWAVRQQIVQDYLSTGQPLQPLPGAKPPNDFPPGKFKPPVLLPGSCIPQLNDHIAAISRAIGTTCAPTIFEGSVVAVLVEASIFDRLVGPDVVAQQLRSMRVEKRDPMMQLYRETLTVLAGAAAAHGVVGLVLGLLEAMALEVEFAPAQAVGGVIILTLRAGAARAAAVAKGTGLIESLVAGLRGALSLRSAVAVGATFLVFVTPRASSADPANPVAVDVSIAKFLILTPSEGVRARVGDSRTIDGVQYKIAGVATTPPD